jgi:hypothetical protein
VVQVGFKSIFSENALDKIFGNQKKDQAAATDLLTQAETLHAFAIDVTTKAIWGQVLAYQALNAVAGSGGISNSFGNMGSTGNITKYGGGHFMARQHGGPVAANEAYIVGEKGPELFVPGSKGYVVPPNKLTTPPTAVGSAPNVKIVLNNNTGVDTTPTVEAPRFDGSEWVINVVLDAYDRNKSGLRDVMRNK